MSKSPWHDENNLRQEAERLIASYGHLWPTRCDHLKCTKPFPRSFTKDQAKSGNFTIRRFRCSGCKTTIGVTKAIETLRPVQQDPDLAAQLVSAMMQPQILSSPPPAPQRASSVPARQSIPLDRSLHVSDLDSVHEDDNMLDASDNTDDSADDSSPLVHYASSRPEAFQTPSLPQRVLATVSPMGTQVFGSPLPSQIPYWSTTSPQSVYPSQLSPWSGGFQSQPHLMFQPQPSAPHSPSLHPSQWSYMSGASPAPTMTQVPPTQVASSPSPAPQAPPVAAQVPVHEFRASPQAESSTAAGKRRHMEASTWLQKQPRLDASYHMAPDQSAAIQQALDISDRTAQQLMAANQALQSQLQALVTEVSQLRKELQESRQALEVAKAMPQPAVVTSPLPTTAPSAAPVPQPPPAKPTETASLPQTVVQVTQATESDSAVPTYASAARQGLTEAQLAVIQSMKPPPRPFKARQPASAAPKPDMAPVQVYFSGVQSGPLKVFKERLRALRVRTSQIYNISFVGKSICEFLVDASYQTKFIESMKTFTFRHLPNFDPAVPQDPNVTPETRDLLKQAYTRRLTAMASTTNRGFVREVFLSMLFASGSPVPTDLPDLTVPATSDPPSAASEPIVTSEPTSDNTTATKDPAAEDSAGTTDGGKSVTPPACDPNLPSSSSHE